MPTPSEYPIAAYTQKDLLSKRVFSLYSDKIVIVASKVFVSITETTLPLNVLSSNVSKIKIRNPLFTLGLWFVGSPVPLFMYFVSYTKPSAFNTFLVLAGILISFGIVLLLLGREKREYVYFYSKAGIPALDVGLGRNGVRLEFDEFTEHISRLVKTTEKSS